MLNSGVRQKIEARFGRPIRYSKDCEALAASIHRACQERISPTTLKRLFGFAKTIDQPRRFTLDVLAAYTGHRDWQNLQAEVTERNGAAAGEQPESTGIRNTASDTAGVYRLNHHISIAKASNTIDLGKVVELAREFGHLPAFIPFITDLIDMAANQNNTELLAGVFMLPCLFDTGMHGVYERYYVGQAMGFVLRRSTQLADELIPTLAKNKHAQQYLIEWFVDEDYLTGYYGRLLDAYHLYKKEDPADLLFYFALKYKQCVMLGDVVGRIGWYRKIKALTFTRPLYQILAARYLGTCLAEEREHIFQPSSPYYTILLKYLQDVSYDVSINFVLFLSRELFLHKRTDWLVQLLVDFGKIQSPEAQDSKTHLTLNIENQLEVYNAFVAHQLGDSKKAIAHLKKVYINLFDPFMYQHMLNDYDEVKKCLGE